MPNIEGNCNNLRLSFVYWVSDMIYNIKFKLILQQYKHKIYSYCRYILRNRMDAEDITQEVMIRFWENMDQINMMNIKSWLYRTAYNRCIDLLRKRKLELNREISLDESMEECFAVPETNIPNKAVETKEQNEILIIAINNLPEDQKNVLIMYELQGLKYREISDVMGLPINTVKVYIMRARKNLHNSIKNNEVFANGSM